MKAKSTFEIEQRDCLKALSKLPAGQFQLIIADPPYNIGKKYENYDDNRPHAEFMQWTESWLYEAFHVLHANGSMWVFAPDEWVSELDVFCRQTLHLHRRSWIVWHYTFGVANQNNFSRSHTHVLYFTKHRTKFTFNREAVRVPSARQLVYNDKRQRTGGKQPDNSWMLLKEELEKYMTPDTDSWLVSRVCGTYKERRKHSSNQIPVTLMERIILATSSPGDYVLDPFGGTFSSGEAALSHGRLYLGLDISKTCVTQGRARLAAVQRRLKKAP